FTTLAFSSDFTTMSMSAIGCSNGAPGSSGWSVGGAPLPSNPNYGCGAAVYFGTDQGSQALFLHWQPGFDNNADTWCSTTAFTCNVGLTTVNGPEFPLNAYVEIVARWNEVAPGNGEQWAFWSWWPKPPNQGYERDFIEWYGGSTDFTIIDWDPSYNGAA